MEAILIAIIIIFIIYTIIPNYYYRNISKSIVKNINNSNKEIALTFDDGPDSRYTNKLLDILEENNIKCTFFLVADKAKKNTGIVERMVNEGHCIGLHSLDHRSAWLSLIWQTKSDFKESISIFKSLGIDINLFRPPWGTFNLFTQYYANKYGLKSILWSINARDWSSKTSSNQIKEKIIREIKTGDIIVLHDSNGAEGAPERTIEALKEIIPKLKQEGFKFVTIEQKVGDVANEQNC